MMWVAVSLPPPTDRSPVPSIPLPIEILPAPEIESDWLSVQTAPADGTSVTFCVASSDNVSGSAAVGSGESRVIVCDPAGSWNSIVWGMPDELFASSNACRNEPGPLSALLETIN